jgi:hypothetical protein
MSSSNTPVEKDYDPVKNPRPEDLHAYGIGNALICWFAGFAGDYLLDCVLVGLRQLIKSRNSRAFTDLSAPAWLWHNF